MLKVAEFLGGFYAIIAVYGGFYAIIAVYGGFYAVIAVYGGFYAVIAVYTVVSLTGHAIADWLERRYAPNGHRA